MRARAIVFVGARMSAQLEEPPLPRRQRAPSNVVSGVEQFDLASLAIVLHAEVERAAILAALSTAVTGALAQGSMTYESRTLLDVFPRDSADFLLASSRLGRFFNGTAPERRLAQFNGALADAKAATIAVLGNAKRLEFEEAVLAWRLVCMTAKDLLRALEDVVTQLGFAGTAEAGIELSNLLDDSIRGNTSIVDADGQFKMPSWAERRRSRRVSVRCRATLITRDNHHHIMIRDVSLSGVGIECDKYFEIGQRVTIVAPNNLVIEGKVAWCREGRAGVELDSPLYGTDPRYGFLESAS